jgi:hypothetical protein
MAGLALLPSFWSGHPCHIVTVVVCSTRICHMITRVICIVCQLLTQKSRAVHGKLSV